MEMKSAALLDLAARLRNGALVLDFSELRSINFQVADDIAAIVDPAGSGPVSAQVVALVREQVGMMPRGSAVLLVKMLQNPGQVQTFYQLRSSRNSAHYTRRSLAVFAHHLRCKLAVAGFENAVRSDRGAGYHISGDDAHELIEHYSLREIC